MLKLPRTIRLDPSDAFVFERAADPGEWAVSGAFVFGDCNDPTALGQKQRVALRSGFLGIESLGWSTLAIVTEATEADMQGAVERLAAHLLWRNSARPILRLLALRRKKRSPLRLPSAIIRRRRCSPCSATSRMARSASGFAR